MFGTVVRASGRPEIHARLKEALTTHFADPLVGRLEGKDGVLRAHLFAAQLVGLMAAVSVYEDPCLMEAAPDDVVRLYSPGLQSLLS
jgi:hypothetical protein